MDTHVRSAFSSRLRVSARDRRRAAVHEAGHEVMASHLGIWSVEAEIRKVEPRDNTEKEWVGSVRWLVDGAAARKRMMVAVAGFVAEACWNGEVFEDLCDTLESFP